MRRFPTALCADGCGALASPRSLCCQGCAAGRPVREDAGDSDLEVLLLRERLSGGGHLTRRLAAYGPGECIVCRGDTLRGRLYCSRACRSDGGLVAIDGIVATPLKHAARLGIGGSTLYRRLQLGMTVEEALARPVNAEMSRRARAA